jgi:hypothetical protein
VQDHELAAGAAFTQGPSHGGRPDDADGGVEGVQVVDAQRRAPRRQPGHAEAAGDGEDRGAPAFLAWHEQHQGIGRGRPVHVPGLAEQAFFAVVDEPGGAAAGIGLALAQLKEGAEREVAQIGVVVDDDEVGRREAGGVGDAAQLVEQGAIEALERRQMVGGEGEHVVFAAEVGLLQHQAQAHRVERAHVVTKGLAVLLAPTARRSSTELEDAQRHGRSLAFRDRARTSTPARLWRRWAVCQRRRRRGPIQR